MRRGIAAFVGGLIFALGLGLSGMTSPRKVIGFLDFAGRWDASLLVVMGGAVGVFAVGHRLVMRRAAPLLDDRFHVAPAGRLDARAAIGGLVFGLGWGLGGYCPGPALVAVASGAPAAVVFTAAMVLGMAVYEAVAGRAPEAVADCE